MGMETLGMLDTMPAENMHCLDSMAAVQPMGAAGRGKSDGEGAFCRRGTLSAA
jgi:hypothetical protein